VEGRRAVNLAVIACAELLQERLASAGLAELVRQSTLRRVYDADYGGREECLALMQRATQALAELERSADDFATIKSRVDRLRSTAAYRADTETVPQPETLQTAGRVLAEEYWDVYRALLR